MAVTDQQYVQQQQRLARLETLLRQLQGATRVGGSSGPLIIGEVRFIAVLTTPTGWLLCDGTPYSRTTYKALFDAIKTTYGAGDGSTTFNVPNLAGRAPVGPSGGHPAGAAYGTADAQLPSHQHSGSSSGALQDGAGATLDHLHVPASPGYYFEVATVDPGMLLGGGGTGSWSTNYPQGGDVGINGTTGSSDRSLDHYHSFDTDFRGGSPTGLNVPPSLPIPAYIFAGS